MMRLLTILVLLTASAQAEWISIDRFGGLVTSEDAVSIPLNQARLVDGWQVRNGQLERAHFTRYAQSTMAAVPTYIIGQSATANAVLVYSDGIKRLKDGVLDAVTYTIPIRTDSAYSRATTDSIIYCWEHLNQSVSNDSTNRYWLNFALTNRSTIYWGDTNYSVKGFYSNRWIQLNRVLNRAIDTLPLNPDIPTLAITEGSGTVDYRDTTLIFDGDYMWKYSGQNDAIVGTGATTVDYPFFKDTGRVLNTYMAGASDTLLIMVINPTDSLRGKSYTRFHLLWDDTLRAGNHAQPCSVIVADTTNPDSVKLTLMADSGTFAAINHFWGRSDTTGAGASGTAHMYYILYQAPAYERYADLGYHGLLSVGGIPTSIDSLTYVGKFGDTHFATLNTHYDHEYGPVHARSHNTRTTDCNVWALTTAQSQTIDDDTVNCRILSHDTTSTSYSGKAFTKFLLWDRDTIKASEWGTGTQDNNLNYLLRRTRLTDWEVTTTGAVADNYRFAVLHRQRSFQSGNTVATGNSSISDSSAVVMYSGIVNNSPTGTAGTGAYSVFPSANKLFLEGVDPVTGLSSLGQSLAIYRRRGIQTLTGFAVSDFYTQPAPVGIGAVNHGTISRSVQDNADAIVNENGMFLFNGSGLEPLSPHVYELFADSVNWNAEEKLRGAVWDNMYFVTAPFDTFTNNNRVVGLDLETRDAWTMTKPRAASVWNFKDDDGSEEMYLGDRDSSIIWQMNGAYDNLWYRSDWRSGWSDLGSPYTHKIVNVYEIDYKPASSGDTLFVDWYAGLSETPVWTDAIVSTAAGNTTRTAQVSRLVQGDYISFGLRSSDSSMVVNRFAFDFTSLGEKRK